MTDSRRPRLLKHGPQDENPFAKLIPDQEIAIVPEFKLESGATLYNVPVAYTTKGQLSPQGDNVMVICHALSGSADVSDWWGPLLGGTGKAFDTSRFFVICINSLGSPYGTASPMTNKNGDPALGHYGPDFPLTTIRDDVRLSRILLDDLGVKQVAAVVGGSMGGAMVLEYAYFGKEYVRCIVPIATSARHSAWCISWGEAQRQSIYSDPKYEDGYYTFDDPPATGLGAARMAALLTYRSRDSFESRFGRKVPILNSSQNINGSQTPTSPGGEHFAIHNQGHRNAGSPRYSVAENSPTSTTPPLTPASSTAKNASEITIEIKDPQFSGATVLPTNISVNERKPASTYFSAQSYLRYQGQKFIKRFDANCYIAITRKLDTHDVAHHCRNPDSTDALHDALSLIEQPALVLGIESDGLFTFAEQQEIARGIPNARLEKIDSPEGHDAFLLQFEQVNTYILQFLNEVIPDMMAREPAQSDDTPGEGQEFGVVTKTSVFGEAEVEDITSW